MEKIIQLLTSNDRDSIRLGAILALSKGNMWCKKNIPKHSDNCNKFWGINYEGYEDNSKECFCRSLIVPNNILPRRLVCLVKDDRAIYIYGRKIEYILEYDCLPYLKWIFRTIDDETRL